MRTPLVAALVVGGLLLTGCAGPSGPPPAEAQVFLNTGQTATQTVPVPGYEDAYFVLERPGRVLLITEDQPVPLELLDLRDRVSTRGERGLTAMVAHPDFQENGMVFIAYSSDESPGSKAGSSSVERYVADPGDVAGGLAFVDRLFRFEWRLEWHQVAGLRFGPDGMLYVGVGDGSEKAPAQNLSRLAGSLLRVNVDDDEGYTVPEDNPFVGIDDARAEIWLYGLRNPWRFDWDAQNDLFIADVGADSVEEVDRFPADGGVPRNFGWPHYEGTQPFIKANGDPWSDGLPVDQHTFPIAEYTHEDGCAVIGGVVYRGAAFPYLEDRFVVGEHCTAQIYIVEPDGEGWALTEWFALDGDRINSIDADADGELLVSGFSGRVYRVVPA